MSEVVPALSTPEGVPAEACSRLLAAGRDRGSVPPDDRSEVRRSVELSPELIDAVVARVRAEGIVYEDPAVEVAHEVIDLDDADATPPPPTKSPAVVKPTRAVAGPAVVERVDED